MKSAIGIGSLLMDGLGDTIRVSLTEDPEFEMEPCSQLAVRNPETLTPTLAFVVVISTAAINWTSPTIRDQEIQHSAHCQTSQLNDPHMCRYRVQHHTSLVLRGLRLR